MVKKWLCQDCLALTISVEEPICRICFGETCNCFTCENSIKLLEKGIRDYKELGLKNPIYGWSKNGIIIDYLLERK